MVLKTNLVMGFLLVVLSATAIYIQLSDANVKMRIDDDKSTFYVLEDGRWRVSGREFVSIWDGTTKLNRRLSGINRSLIYDFDTKITVVTRFTPYIRGPVILETWTFDGTISDVELFPISHVIKVVNASGYIFQYEVRDLIYSGETVKDVQSPMFFGRNMIVEWQEGYYWSKVFKSGILKVRYRPQSNHEVYKVRLFDPANIFKDYYEAITKYNETSVRCIKRGIIVFENGTTQINACLEMGSVTVERTNIEKIKDGAVRVSGKVINYSPDRWCVYVGSLRVDCGQVDASIHRLNPTSWTGCNRFGGQDCLILKFLNAFDYDVSHVNSDIYIEGMTSKERRNMTVFPVIS